MNILRHDNICDYSSAVVGSNSTRSTSCVSLDVQLMTTKAPQIEPVEFEPYTSGRNLSVWRVGATIWRVY